MGLENAGDLPSGEHLPYRGNRALKLLGVVGVVVNIAEPGTVHVHIESSDRSFERCNRVTRLLCVHSVAQAHREGGYAVLYIHPSYRADLYVGKNPCGIYQVVGVVALGVEPEIASVEVCPLVIIMVSEDFCRGTALVYGQGVFEYQGLADLGGELAERFLHAFEAPVYVQMVCVHRSYGGNCGVKLKERAVELVSLGHYQGSAAYQHIGAVVLRNPSKEG